MIMLSRGEKIKVAYKVTGEHCVNLYERKEQTSLRNKREIHILLTYTSQITH